MGTFAIPGVKIAGTRFFGVIPLMTDPLFKRCARTLMMALAAVYIFLPAGAFAQLTGTNTNGEIDSIVALVAQHAGVRWQRILRHAARLRPLRAKRP